MFIEKLKLVDYRNYENITLEFSKPIIIILGMNGQGKSNILEAICFLTTKNSFRARQNKEMIRWDRSRSLIKGRLRSGSRNDEIEIIIEEESGATVLRNKVKEKRVFGDISSVVFTPDDLQIIKGGPQKRRQYIDNVVSKIKPTFIFTLINYNRVLQQRNAFLKQGRGRGVQETQIWNEKIVSLGVKIILERDGATRTINNKAREIYRELMQGKERNELSIHYLSSAGNCEEAEKIKEELVEELRVKEAEEREKGITLVGPHRDDLAISVSGREARLYASQGEERGIVLALKLSEAEVLREEKGHSPLILFDDVLSELDEEVKKSLVGRLNGANQIFITATSGEGIPGGLEGAQWMRVESGRVING